jgi:predicted permease
MLWWRRTKREEDLERELHSDLELEAEEQRENGLSPEEARYAARRAFGNTTWMKEETRNMWGWTAIERLVQDLRYAIRTLKASPGFVIAATMSLGLGIGANTALFSVVDALLLKSLPVQNPERLFLLGSSERDVVYSHTMYKLFRDDAKTFSGLLAVQEGIGHWNVVNQGGEMPEQVDGALVSGNYFAVLGVPALLGRTFTADDDRIPGGRPFVMMSYRYWQQRFNRNPSAVGMTIRINRSPYTVIGVAPPEFFGDQVGAAPDLWAPLMMQPQISGASSLDDVGSWWLHVMGRLRPGVSEQQAAARMTLLYKRAISGQLASIASPRHLQNLVGRQVKLLPGSKGLSDLRRKFSEPLQILMGVVGLVLLIACVNVANLLLSRSASRRREIGTRLALGASRSRIVRQLLTESILLSVLGAILGWGFARWGVHVLLGLLSTRIALDVHPDMRLFAFTTALCLGTGIVVGIIPALRATQIDLRGGLTERSSHGGGRSVLGKTLVIAQVGLSLLLLVGAGLIVRSLQNVLAVDAGYHRDQLLVLNVSPGAAGYHGNEFLRACRQLLDRLGNVPGVTAASFSMNGLFLGGDNAMMVRVPDRPDAANPNGVRVDWIGPSYFSAVGIPLLLGRDIDSHDQADSRRVAVINDAFARTFLPGINPIGHRLLGNPNHPTEAEVIGVAQDVKDHSLRDQPPTRCYLAFLQEDPELFRYSTVKFELQTIVAPLSLASAVRQTIHKFDRNIPILEISPLTALVKRSLSQEELVAKLTGLFSVLALLLACIGLYGLMSYAVARRTSELGIRLALGAQSHSILWLVLRETLALVTIGLVVGTLAAFAVTRVLSNLLFGLTARDPQTFVLAAGVLIMSALVAGYLPAFRASRVDPLVALRCE